MKGIGGAMDLVSGARRVFVVMRHTDKQGRPKLVESCTMPVTGRAVVDRIFTELAVFDVIDGRLILRELAPDTSVDDVAAATGADYEIALTTTLPLPAR
jgi:3-oxoacid CoA-transferase subunit B